jgi:hypothetical protein
LVSQLFRWEVALGIVGILATVSLGLAALDIFRPAEIIFGLVGVYSIGAICNLRFFRAPWTKLRVMGLLISLVAVVLCSSMVIFGIGQYGLNKELEALSGVIIPGDEPTPRLPNATCTAMNIFDFTIIVGNAWMYTPNIDRTIVEIDGKPALTLNRERGGLTISLKVMGQDGRVVVEILKNRFVINPNNYFKIQREGRNELAVYDQSDDKVLDIHYFNEKTIKVLAELRTGGHHVSISDSAITVDGSEFRGPGGGRFCTLIPGGYPLLIVDRLGTRIGTRNEP